MGEASIEAEINGLTDRFVEQFKGMACDFAKVRGFLSAAIGHAAARLSDRSPLERHLLGAAEAFDRNETPRSRHDKPSPWLPVDGEIDMESFAAEKVADTISKMHLARPRADPTIINFAALAAAFIMLGWHGNRAAAAVLRTKASSLKDVPFQVH